MAGERADAAAKVVPANSMLRRLSRFEPAASGDFSVRMRHVLAEGRWFEASGPR